MRILLVVGAYPPSDKHGGPAVATHSLAKALNDLGYGVFVLTTDINGTGRLDIPRGETQWDGVPVRYCRWVRCPLPYYSPELGRELARRVSSFDVALISSAWTMYGVSAGYRCRQSALPYVMYAHGSFGPAHLRRRRVLKTMFWWTFDRRLYNRSAAVVALTESEKLQMRRAGIRPPIHVIPNGVRTEELEAAGPRQELETRWPQLRGRPYVLFLGRLEKIKGIDVLLRAFNKARRSFPESVLVLAGPSERGHGRQLERLVDLLGLSGSVLFTGAVRGTTKASLLRHAQVFALTSRGEGLPMAVLEALAVGIPVVISPACNLPEVQQSRAGLVVPCAEQEVEAALSSVLSDPDLRTIMGENGKRLVSEKYTWQKVAADTAALCRSVVRSRTASSDD